MIRIFKTSLSSSSDSPEVLTAESGQQTSPGRRGFSAKALGHRSTGGGASLLSNKRLTLPFLALLVVMAAGLLFLMPGGPLHAQQTAETYYHHENDMGPVVTLTANDPEKVTPIYWSFLTDADGAQDLPGGAADDIADTDIADRASFTVDGGVLMFKDKPDFEAPPSTNAIGNTYKVVVQASDGGLTTWVQYFKVTVNVLDVEEDGEVEWTVDPDGDGTGADEPAQDLLEFQAGAILSATVTDPDGPDTIVEDTTSWRWYRSPSMSARGTMITDEATSAPVMVATYTASDHADNNDVGMYLRAVATYTDRRGANKTAEFVSPHTVKAAKVEDNSLPVFAPTAVARDVQEGPAGRNVGAPVTATDADGDVRNYTLGGDDVASFEIDQATGQITTAVALDYDEDPTERSFTVTVTATDSAGGNTRETDAPVDATVTITLLDVNEAPDFTTEDRTTTPPANIQGMAADMAEEGVGNPLTAPYVVSAYTVTDPEGVVINEGKWSLSGDDAALFKLTGTADNTRTLEFIDKADFEMPGDRNMDNIYEVTVVASDGEEMAGRAVTVKITDSDEAGKITLSTANPVTGTEITAMLEDSDGDVINIAWTWYALDDTEAATLATIAAGTAVGIEDEKSNTYTPGAGDIGKHLVAAASYMDRTEDTDNNAATPDPITNLIRFDNMAQSMPTAPVIDDPANAAPMFVEGETATRYVEEDDDSDEPIRNPAETIGAPLMITDADGMAATSHAYTLSGTDAASFDINAASGQLMTKAALDFEDKNTYTVVVTVDDGSGESNATDRITVTIQVKDLDEKPVIVEGGLAITGMRSVSYAENRMDAVATYTATGPEAASVTWSLEGAGDFRISSDGMLSFRSYPDFENPTDADMDNTYEVTIKANDGTYMDTQEVMVMVTNVDEIGTLSGPETVSNYMENSEDPVGTYTVLGGSMSEMANLTLIGDDAGDFMLSSDGMLKFSSAPDYEMPRGRAMSDTNTNTYMVTVKAEAGGEMDMVEVTVMVTNVDEEGTVTLSSMTPVVGVALTATLTDPDGGVTGEMWQWYKSMDSTFMDGDEMEIGDATSAYTPMADDEGYHLMVKVTYDDDHGTGKSQSATTANPVTSNTAPMFADDSTTRTVEENSAGGTNVGDPVMAADAGDTLTYALSGDDAMYFDIGESTGQITVGADAMLDYEADKNEYMVTVTATDSQDATDTIDVTIMVTDVMVGGDATLNSYDANGNEMIEKSEVIAAINDYLFGTGAGAISKADVIKLINLYLFG